MTMPQIKPSPVHESSLKQALQRVEDRIRRQEAERQKDDRHSRTLKLARELAEQGVRQRQRNWEKNHQKNKEDRPIINTAQPDAGPAVDPAQAKTDTRLAQEDTPVSGNGHQTRHKKGDAVPTQGIIESSPTAEPFVKATESPASDTFQTPLRHSSSIIRPRSGPGIFDKGHKRGLMRVMPVVAWLILCAGLIGAVLSWTTITDVQADPLKMSPSKFDPLSMGLLLGFAYLATGVLGFAFFWVSSQISNQLREIRRLLFLQPTMAERADTVRNR
jgi:hypothetical protein